MKNKDFRDRLKNHTRDVNPNSWEQMESLLDSVTDTKDKKKRGFWFFLFGLGLVGITWVAFQWVDSDFSKTSMYQDKVIEKSKLDVNIENQELAPFKERLSDNVEERLNNQNNVNQGKSINEMNPDKTLQGSETDLLEEKESGLDQKTNGSLSSNTRTVDKRRADNTETLVDTRGINSNSKKEAKSEHESNNNLVEDQLSDQNNNKPSTSFIPDNNEGVATQTDVKIDNNESENSEPTNVNQDSGMKDASSEISNEDLRVAELPIEDLNLLLRGIISTEKDKLKMSPEVKINKPSGFESFVGAGYAVFNENPGFIVNAGVSYDVDRIIDLETNIGYAYGSEQNIPNGEVFTFEKQFDLSFLIHLNFIKSQSHKFSLIAGIGYSFYSGTRVIDSSTIIINERKSRGRNLQGGFDYRFRIRKNNSIGLRVGLISYDDSVLYFSTRFVKEF